MSKERDNQLKKIDNVTNDILKESQQFNYKYNKISESTAKAIENINSAIKELETVTKEAKNTINETTEVLEQIKSFQKRYTSQIISNGEELNEYMASFDGKVRAFLKDKVEKPVIETLEDLSTSANQDFKEIIDKIEKLEKALIKKTK